MAYKNSGILLVALTFFLCSFLPATKLIAGEIQGQKQMLVIEDTFQFIPGTWAKYTVRDKREQEEYLMTLSVLQGERRQHQQCYWLEVIIESQKASTVVTQFLTPQTKQGPGKVLEAIVQVDGYAPFTVPHHFLEGEEAEVGQTLSYQLVRKVRKKVLNFRDRKVNTWLVEARDNNQQSVHAWVSEELPPIGIFKVDTSDVGMYLEDWGNSAHSNISGTPMNFYLWLTTVIGKAFNDTTTE